jgi:DNA repair protein RAD16
MKDGGPLNVEAGEVHGWDEVEDPSEIVELSEHLVRTVPPDHIGGEINVEDESFLKSAVSAQKKHKSNPPRLPAPSSMTVKLLPFQEEGHAWMLDREKNSVERGGILADEMGLGKTIQTISLIVSGKANAGKQKLGPTLIVAPSSAMLQWQDEINRCTKEGTLSVLVYQSAKRKGLTPADILNMDVILTSYPILESEYRQAINSQKVDCVYCGRKFLKRKLGPHHKYFCGPEAQKTERLMKQEKTREESTRKAMVTLRIGTKSAPTPTAIYRELMLEAGRTPSSMHASAEEARAVDASDHAEHSGRTSQRNTPENPRGSPHPQPSMTPDIQARASEKKLSAPKSKAKSKAKKAVSDDEEDEEEEVKGGKGRSDKKVRFTASPESSDFEKTPGKRTSALKAKEKFINLVESDSDDGD